MFSGLWRSSSSSCGSSVLHLDVARVPEGIVSTDGDHERAPSVSETYIGFGNHSDPFPLRKEMKMGIGTSLVIFAVGAIMRFAVSVTATGFNIHTIGVILMIVGGVGLILSGAFWNSWGGFGGSSRQRRTTVNSPSGTTTTTSEEHIS